MNRLLQILLPIRSSTHAVHISEHRISAKRPFEAIRKPPGVAGRILTPITKKDLPH
jgi:hypothetical protein